MNPSDYPVAKRELQGPRPTALKVHKDSHKIKKPPLAPSSHQHQQQQQQPPPPVIIYTVSPKVIHTNPSDFMSLVQRLTGSSSSNSGAISPAARYATIEKTREGKKTTELQTSLGPHLVDMGIEMTPTFPAGILSPGPTTLPPISPNFFDSNMLGNLLSPMVMVNQQGTNKIHFMEAPSFMPSPTSTNFFISPHFPSPTIDLFNHFFDL